MAENRVLVPIVRIKVNAHPSNSALTMSFVDHIVSFGREVHISISICSKAPQRIVNYCH